MFSKQKVFHTIKYRVQQAKIFHKYFLLAEHNNFRYFFFAYFVKHRKHIFAIKAEIVSFLKHVLKLSLSSFKNTVNLNKGENLHHGHVLITVNNFKIICDQIRKSATSPVL